MSAQKDDRKPQPQLPLREIPGDYGLPLFGPIKDRLDFFYNQGRDNFFISRIQKHQSTVFRTNLPPGPFISSNPQVVALLDTKSFPVLLDNSKIDKRDAFVGTYKPSSAFNGGYRVCGYLDTSEPDHAALKYWFLSQLAARKDRVIPLFRRHLADLFLKLEDQLVKNGKVDFNKLSEPNVLQLHL
ncbi:hypothetical protein M0R45_007951 [Rubus argutus]|uniref:Allene oxide synthase n=1 Tax=Rubus argutus TaxID=59490 RepID=A0AAW1Y0P5_RUBAR